MVPDIFFEWKHSPPMNMSSHGALLMWYFSTTGFTYLGADRADYGARTPRAEGLTTERKEGFTYLAISAVSQGLLVSCAYSFIFPRPRIFYT